MEVTGSVLLPFSNLAYSGCAAHSNRSCQWERCLWVMMATPSASAAVRTAPSPPAGCCRRCWRRCKNRLTPSSARYANQAFLPLPILSRGASCRGICHSKCETRPTAPYRMCMLMHVGKQLRMCTLTRKA
eukprot:1156090-Pelagomonas_calceolata.AAC.9